MEKQMAGEFSQRLLIYIALESDDRIQGHPVLAPTPGIELRMIAGTQANICIAASQPQQKPDLFLAPVSVTPFAAHPVPGYVVTQPVSRAPENLDMFRHQPDLFVQFAIHGLFRRLALIYATLRKLPGMLADTLPPEDFVSTVYQDNADVRAIAFTIEHV